MRRAGAGGLVVVAGALGIGAASYVPWEDLTEADWLYGIATRFATVDGHRVHYPTPTAELVQALDARPESAALRHLAEARLALGDRPGAVAALERWAEAEGAVAWAEAARWGAAHADLPLAFRAAERARPGLHGDELRALADDEIAWADAHPDLGDPLALRKTRAELFPEDSAAVEDWIRALEEAGRLPEADAAVGASRGLDATRRLLLRSDLAADHGEKKRAFDLLDEALASAIAQSPDVREAFAKRTAEWSPGAPESWRAGLEQTFDARALLRLASYFQGEGRGDAAADLLRQVERRYEPGFGRSEHLLLERLHAELDAIPEAFRSALAAAQRGSAAEQTDDLARLGRLALRAGGRPLGWGTYNDEPYRWVARLDRTPGFWTGGLSFLLTGQDWKEALAHLETESLPERTFATARLLLDELVRRAHAHAEIPRLRALVMARYVERGDGRAALGLLPLLETGPAEIAAEAERIALLAAREVEVPLREELRLYRARLSALAPAGSRPRLMSEASFNPSRPSAPAGSAWRRPAPTPSGERYKDVLETAVARLDQRDPGHRAAVDLLLGEMDRLPDAEDLWADLASRLEQWNLDDDLGPRYERALERFSGPDWWARAARFYARRSRKRDLERLAGELAGRFRGAAIFSRTAGTASVQLDLPSQPLAGTRVRLVAWADFVRLKALERFPHSPQVFQEAAGHLLARGEWVKTPRKYDQGKTQPVIAEDKLFEERGWALLFTDAARREAFFAAAARAGDLEKRLVAIEAAATRTPVEDQILFEGWSRLSRFERAAAPADRLASVYPGDGPLARRVLTLHRSLAALEPGHTSVAETLVARTAPALQDPNPLFTELGEMQQEGGHPEPARKAWDRFLERAPRDPERILELATILWDYGRMAEALAVIEDDRRRLKQPHLHAFEGGVLREETRDIQGAVREYLAAAIPDDEDCFCSWFERDQRALRRLSQLLGRDRVLALVLAQIDALRAGVKADEEILTAFLPLARIGLPDAGLDWTADDWIDGMDQPRDPVGRAARAEARSDWRPKAQAGIARVGEALLQKTAQMVARASAPQFLDAVEPWSRPLLDRDAAKDRSVSFQAALLLRRAELAPTDEERVTREVARARYLFENGRPADADAAWAKLLTRISTLPEGAPRMHAEADRAAYLERVKGTDAAAAEWTRLASRYPWSLGLLEDRVAFLTRAARGAEARGLIESAIGRAASGHRENLLTRLTQEALAASDLAQAQRALTRLMGEPALAEGQRLAALPLLGRLSLRQDPRFDLVGLAKTEGATLKPELRADVYRALAEAAEAEHADPLAVTLWIEALNRRPERSWLRSATRAADHAGQSDSFRRFFEDQQARSPRDVRWAVTVREVRLGVGDLEGAITMAKTALAVRPDLHRLWTEAADLLVRAGRPRDAADLLEGWQRPRPADEDAARERSALYAQANDPAKALGVEQAALDAFKREAPRDEDRAAHIAERRARAVGRLRELGLPRPAWRMAVGAGGAAALGDSGLGDAGAAELALVSGNFMAALAPRLEDEGFRDAAARALADRGHGEVKDEVLGFMLDQLLPKGPPQARSVRAAALAQVWPFATTAGLEVTLRAGVAGRLVAATPGPWQADPSPTFLNAVAEAAFGAGASGAIEFREPAFEALWVRDLVRRARDEALWAFLEPRWKETVARVRLGAPLAKDTPPVAWATWLNDKETMAAWARGAALQAERTADIASILSTRRSWDRLWAVAARDWDVGPLVAVVPEEARAAWFRHWQVASPLAPSPVLSSPGETMERVSLALARLVEGRPGAAADPLIDRLRGPRTVGDVLGKDPRWLWPELTAAPGLLWGERPGAAWFVLETLARLRQGDHAAPLVPGELPERGGELVRGLLAVQLAEALGDEPLALALDHELPGAGDVNRLAERLRLLAKGGHLDDARSAFAAEVRRQQPALGESGYLHLRRLGDDLGLEDPLGLMDPATPVSPAFLAFLYDWRGPGPASRFRTTDRADFRTALANRWRSREASLSADAVRFHLAELWANDAAPLPLAGLSRIGPPWPQAGAWLGRLRVRDRAEGLAALGALPEPARLETLLAADPEPKSDAVRLLRLWLALSRDETGKATALVDELLAEVEGGSPLAFASAPPAPAPSASMDDEATGEAAVEAAAPDDGLTGRLVAWLAPFRETKRVDLVRGKLEDGLRKRRERGLAAPTEWALAYELAAGRPEEEALRSEMERAFIRGDLAPDGLGPLVEALARAAPDEARRWLGRWPTRHAVDDVARRARALVAMKDKTAGALAFVEGRAREMWTSAEDVQAFDLWRRIAPTEAPAAGPASTKPSAPAAWTRARAFWQRKANDAGSDLAIHLKAHPTDVLAARAALRSAAPGDEAAMSLAGQVLQGAPAGVLEEPYADAALLDLRTARGLLATAPAAAPRALGTVDGATIGTDLMRRRMPTAEIDSALGDIVRILGRGGREENLEAPLLALERRNAEMARRLRVEIRDLMRPARPTGYRLAAGSPAPYRPRDLEWSVVSRILAAERPR